MIIQHNISAINSYRNLGTNQSQLSKNLEKLSSGYKINRAGDNAAGLAISEQMRAQIAGLNQSVTNAKDAIGMIQTAEGALTETHSMLNRMATLFTQADNGTYSMNGVAGADEQTARENIQVEIQKLQDEIDRIADNTKFNGIKPLAQDGQKLTFQIGPSAAETIQVTTSYMNVSSLLGGDVDGECLTVADSNTAIDKVNEAINKVSKFRAELGAAQNRLEHTINSLQVSSENITAAESRIRDTDMADEITAYTKNNILLQAAQSMLTQANATPQGVLSMLQ